MRPTPRGTAALLATTALLASVAVAGSAWQGSASSPGAAAVGAGDRCRLPGPYELPHGSERVDLRPRDFTARIDNPYWPMRVGRVWKYRERDEGDLNRVTVRVTDRTKLIRGIRARVVRDVVRRHGRLVEKTFDWYAQDSGGNIWYLGENTKEYERGQVVSTEGSWEYGVDGAQAGVIVPAGVRPGCTYREEYKPDEAEDHAQVLSRRERVRVPSGFYPRVLSTGNTTPLEPALLEHKFYARGVGPVLEIGVSPRPARAVLLKVRH